MNPKSNSLSEIGKLLNIGLTKADPYEYYDFKDKVGEIKDQLMNNLADNSYKEYLEKRYGFDQDFIELARELKDDPNRADKIKSELSKIQMGSYKLSKKYTQVYIKSKDIIEVDQIPDDVEIEYVTMKTRDYYSLISWLPNSMTEDNSVMFQGTKVTMNPEVLIDMYNLQKMINNRLIPIAFEKNLGKLKRGILQVQVVIDGAKPVDPTKKMESPFWN